MKKKSLFFKFIAVNFFFLAFSFCLSDAYAVSSRVLIEDANILDGRIVKYSGEAVTAIMDRGEYAWVNVSDGNNALGVWCKRSMLNDVKFLGDYKCKGDILGVEGVFNQACAEHNGELDIHAVKVSVIERGHAVPEDIDIRNTNFSAGIFLLTLLVLYIFRKKI